MGIEAAAIATLATISAASAAVSYSEAEQQKKAAKKAKESARQARDVQTKQLASQADIETEKQIRQARAIKARALVSAADSGFDVTSGDVDALLRAIDSDTDLNIGIIRDNLNSNQQLVESRANAQFADIDGRVSSPFLQAFQGLLGGAGTGLQLVGGARTIADLETKPLKLPDGKTSFYD